MTVLKIIGITLAAILAFTVILVAWLVSCRIKVHFLFDTASEVECLVKYLFFKFDILKPRKKKESNKKSFIAERLKKALGLDVIESSEAVKQNAKEGGIADTVSSIVTVFSLLAGQIAWLLKRFKINKLRLLAVCAGEDAADAAVEYGLVCASVYPMLGYIDASIKMKKNAKDIQIGCDFNGNGRFALELDISVRLIHVLRALYRSAMDNAERVSYEEANK